MEEDEYLVSISSLSPGKQTAKLMGKISQWKGFHKDVPPAWLQALRALCEPKRYRKWQKRFNRRKRFRSKPAASKPARLKVTRTVEYHYAETDNARLAEFYASREWKLMRYEALRSHGGQCQCCGASPAHGKRLNVDHIKPLRVFWDLRLDLNNLQVLCEDCNEGKGARHADDWR